MLRLSHVARAAGLLLAASLVVSSKTAMAFCRTTTDSGGSQACVRTGKPLFWRNACVGYKVQAKGTRRASLEEVTATVKSTFDAWSLAACAGGGSPSVALSNIGTTASTRVGFDNARGATNENLILFHDDVWPYPDTTQVALTTLTFRRDTGELVDADIEVNGTLNLSTQDPLPRDGFDLATVFAHESGHLLGLAHSEVRAATMFASYDPGTVAQRTLEPDDIEGLCAAYPADGTRATAAGSVARGACAPNATVSLDVDDGEGCACTSSRHDGAPGAAQIALVVACGWLLRRGRARDVRAIDTSRRRP
jgi:hypothetical protein